MSTFTRYAFSLLICVYGIYELLNDHPLPGGLGIALSVFIFWISRRR